VKPAEPGRVSPEPPCVAAARDGVPRNYINKKVVAAIGNPNAGKSTVFNALTGLRQKIANYPGVTVERHAGTLRLGSGDAELVDLPGTYSLAAQSPDEIVAVDVLLGRIPELGRPAVVLLVVDASNLRRNLYLASQVLELDIPVVVALNMMDLARSKGMAIDIERLAARLGVPVVPLVASREKGIDALRLALSEALEHKGREPMIVAPELQEAAQALCEDLRGAGLVVAPYEVERALIDEGGYAETRLCREHGASTLALLRGVRAGLAAEGSVAALETRRRYQWINQVVAAVERRVPRGPTQSDRLDRVLNHPVAGSLAFLLLMAAVFQSVFFWAQPLMDLIDEATRTAGTLLAERLPEGAVASLLVDGIIAGVGSVVVFLPQIAILSAFIIVLEDTGYMARAAFLVDRLMRLCGLSGQSFIPMLSSFACAVPGIMATRVIPNPRDRLATILAAPFMTCSARLPVYTLLISAFVPPIHYAHGLLNLQGLVLLGLYLLGIAGGVGTAWLMKRTLLRGPTPSFLMELPPYRLPRLRSVAIKLTERLKVFLTRAGTIILTVSVVVWALVYFPHPPALHAGFQTERGVAEESLAGDPLERRLAELDRQESAAYLEQSMLGRLGRVIEPVFSPLGWDWKVTAAVIASFPAREVVIAVLGTIYAVGAEVEAEDAGLIERLRDSAWPDGRKVFSVSVAVGLMLFYAFCLQCTATVAVIRRETNSWRWAGFAWVYMTGLGYLGALVSVEAGRFLT
jgi:ferrous iron transport protein B